MAGSSLNGLRILMVDGDYFRADETRAILEEEGADVVGLFPDGASAIHFLQTGSSIDRALIRPQARDGSTSALACELIKRLIPAVLWTYSLRDPRDGCLRRIPAVDEITAGRCVLAALRSAS